MFFCFIKNIKNFFMLSSQRKILESFEEANFENFE